MPLILKIFVENVRDVNIQTRAIFHEAQARAEDLGMAVQIKNSFFAGNQAFGVRINDKYQIADCQRFSEIVQNVAKQYGIAVQWSRAYEN